MKPKVYIAGPYSGGDVIRNIGLAIWAGDFLAGEGFVSFIPHLTGFWHMFKEHEYEFWMEQDTEWLRVCVVVYRMKGESLGADREVELAESLNIPVFDGLGEILDWKRKNYDKS